MSLCILIWAPSLLTRRLLRTIGLTSSVLSQAQFDQSCELVLTPVFEPCEPVNFELPQLLLVLLQCAVLVYEGTLSGR